MKIKVTSDKVSISEVKEIAQEFYKTMIKGAADIESGAVALGGEYHMDSSMVLLESGSKQQDIWGFNVNLQKPKDSPEWIEYVSLINIRPAQGNLSMEVQDGEIKRKIREILHKIIIE